MEVLAGFAKYETYKSSGVDWLEDIPEMWSIVPAKRKHRVEKLINKRNKYKNVLSLTLRGVVNNDSDNPEGLVPRDYASYQLFEKDDLVFKLIDLENLKTSRVGIVHEQGIMSPAYIRLEINDQGCSKYAYYYFYSLYLNAVYNNLGQGVRSTLGPSDLLEIPIIEPRYEEQVAIACFLDNRLIQIDEAIALKERQITLLKERKQIIIQKAVTQGLDPDVSMKDSGVEWIGEIPEHWDISRISFLSSKVGDGLHGTPNYVDESPYPFINGNNIGDGEVVITERTKFVSEEEYLNNKKTLTNNTLLMSINGTIGNLAFYNGESIMLGKSAAYINLESDVNKEFVYYYLKSSIAADYINRELSGSTIKNLSLYSIDKTPVPYPSKVEQDDIVSHIKLGILRVDEIINKSKKEIELIKEYKTALISEVVTGKVDVRDEKIN